MRKPSTLNKNYNEGFYSNRSKNINKHYQNTVQESNSHKQWNKNNNQASFNDDNDYEDDYYDQRTANNNQYKGKNSNALKDRDYRLPQNNNYSNRYNSRIPKENTNYNDYDDYSLEDEELNYNEKNSNWNKDPNNNNSNNKKNGARNQNKFNSNNNSDKYRGENSFRGRQSNKKDYREFDNNYKDRTPNSNNGYKNNFSKSSDIDKLPTPRTSVVYKNNDEELYSQFNLVPKNNGNYKDINEELNEYKDFGEDEIEDNSHSRTLYNEKNLDLNEKLMKEEKRKKTTNDNNVNVVSVRTITFNNKEFIQKEVHYDDTPKNQIQIQEQGEQGLNNKDNKDSEVNRSNDKNDVKKTNPEGELRLSDFFREKSKKIHEIQTDIDKTINQNQFTTKETTTNNSNNNTNNNTNNSNNKPINKFELANEKIKLENSLTKNNQGKQVINTYNYNNIIQLNLASQDNLNNIASFLNSSIKTFNNNELSTKEVNPDNLNSRESQVKEREGSELSQSIKSNSNLSQIKLNKNCQVYIPKNKITSVSLEKKHNHINTDKLNSSHDNNNNYVDIVNLINSVNTDEVVYKQETEKKDLTTTDTMEKTNKENNDDAITNLQKEFSPKNSEANKLKFNLRQVAQSSYESGNLESNNNTANESPVIPVTIKESNFKENNRSKQQKTKDRYTTENQNSNGVNGVNPVQSNKFRAREREVKKPVINRVDSSNYTKTVEEFIEESDDESIVHSDIALLEGQIQANQQKDRIGIHVDKLYSNFDALVLDVIYKKAEL